MSNNQLIVADTSIRTDAEGRYCLNDLHKAAGGENRQRPSLWFANQQAQDLAEEVEAGNPASKPVEFKRGRGITGTYVCKEMHEELNLLTVQKYGALTHCYLTLG